MSDVTVLYPERSRPGRLSTGPNAGRPSVEPPAAWFTRRELDRLLSLYGRMVAAGEWRDYGLADLPDRACFCVYRRAREHALYTIEKIPKQAKRQGAYQIVTATGLILKRGHDLDQVLRDLERKLFKAVE